MYPNLGGVPLTYKTIDLFAGIGGIRRGFEKTSRFQNVLSAEIDPYACKTYEHLFKENPFNDVTDQAFKNKVDNIDYDVLLAGFPCQAFSIAGKKEGFKDKTRGTLFYDIADILERSRPKAFLLENVEGLLRHKKGVTFKIILETLVKELDYKVIGVTESPFTGELIYEPSSFIYNSKYFGVPQNRPRVYIVGFDTKRYAETSSLMEENILPKKRIGENIYDDLHAVLQYEENENYYL